MGRNPEARESTAVEGDWGRCFQTGQVVTMGPTKLVHGVPESWSSLRKVGGIKDYEDDSDTGWMFQKVPRLISVSCQAQVWL